MAKSSYTRAQLERIIADGGSVLHGGRHINRVEDLPTDEELAGDDDAAKQQIADDLQRQIADLQTRRDALLADQAAEPEDEAGSDEPEDYSQMTRNELKAAARGRKLSFAGTASKDDLVALLQESDQAAIETGGDTGAQE